MKTFHLDPLAIAKKIIKIERLLKFKFRRKFGLVDRQIVMKYLSQNNIRKLHIGCGSNLLQGWLNSDYFPRSTTILHLDATQLFPFCNNEFDCIFSEHMIEHISYSQGLFMLNECFRVLKENGTIRISTPDLSFLIDLYKDNQSDLQREYIKRATDRYIKDAPYYDAVFVINNFVRNWGHQFIYNEKILRSSLEKAGFTSITKCALNQSEVDSLRNLENIKRMPQEFLRLETITMEGRKLVDMKEFDNQTYKPRLCDMR